MRDGKQSPLNQKLAGLEVKKKKRKQMYLKHTLGQHAHYNHQSQSKMCIRMKREISKCVINTQTIK